MSTIERASDEPSPRRPAAVDGAPEIARRLAARTDLSLRPAEPLARMTTFRIGGPAELFAEVETDEALAALLAAVADVGVPFRLFGLGSNLLVPDGGLPGVVARLGRGFKEMEVDGEVVSAGAALALPTLARRTARLGLTGLEPLCGFPSTVGGAVWMNAGCYGTEIKDVMIDAALVDREGRRRTITVAELGAGYRSTALQATDAIVTRARFRLARGDSEASLARIEELNERRWSSLPSREPNAGSIFKNPPADYAGRLIEACGLKGRRLGGAEISGRHANVIVNLGDASADDVLGLMLLARESVRREHGLELEPEVILAGELGERWRRAVDSEGE